MKAITMMRSSTSSWPSAAKTARSIRTASGANLFTRAMSFSLGLEEKRPRMPRGLTSSEIRSRTTSIIGIHTGGKIAGHRAGDGDEPRLELLLHRRDLRPLKDGVVGLRPPPREPLEVSCGVGAAGREREHGVLREDAHQSAERLRREVVRRLGLVRHGVALYLTGKTPKAGNLAISRGRVEAPAVQRAAFAILLAVAPTLGCLQLTPNDPDAGSTPITSTTTGDSATVAPAVGQGCATDPDTKATLCTSTSLCPGLTVDQDQFPACGFVINGSVLDLECSCSGELCPMGAPTSCAAAAASLENGSALGVCTQVASDRCTGGPMATTNPNCDKTCESQCGGNPDCIQLCGC